MHCPGLAVLFVPPLACWALACVSPPPTATTAPSTSVSPAGQGTPETPQDMAELERLHQPGPNHEALQGFVGEWEITVEGPTRTGGPLEKVGEGSGTIAWVLKGRFLEWRATLALDEQSIEVIGYVGYDQVARQYQGLWIDDINTGMTPMHGDGDPRRAAGIVLDPIERRVAARKRMRIVDRDTLAIEIIGVDATGEEVVARRSTYRRRATG